MQRACSSQEINADLQSTSNSCDKSQTLQTFLRADFTFRRHVLRRWKPENRDKC